MKGIINLVRIDLLFIVILITFIVGLKVLVLSLKKLVDLSALEDGGLRETYQSRS